MSFRMPENPRIEIALEGGGWWLELDDIHSWILWGGPFAERDDADTFMRWLLAAAAWKRKLTPTDWTEWPPSPSEPVSFDPERARLEAAIHQRGHRLAVSYEGRRLMASCELRSRIDVRGLFGWLGSDAPGIADIEYSIRETAKTDIDDGQDTWFTELERRIQAEKRESLGDDLVERVLDAEWDRAFDTPDPGPTTSNSVTIPAGDAARILCRACLADFEAVGPQLPTIGLRCPWCGHVVMPVELVVAGGGVWVFDLYAGCNARSFKVASGEFVAFCRCDRAWHGPSRPDDAAATQDADRHRRTGWRGGEAEASDVGA